jgi:RNA polymerase sigma factor (sigma-70 family)
VTSRKDEGLFGAVPPRPATLGDVLYRDGAADEALPERDWIVLVNYIAAGDQRALRQLYEHTHRLVFSLIARITNSREVAEDLTIEVFSDLWRRARSYDPASGSVLGWIMGHARLKALGWLQLDRELDSDVLTPTVPLWGAIGHRIVSEYGVQPTFTAPLDRTDPEWKQVSPGISCKILSTDEQRDRVSMLVRLNPGVEYPRHTHAGVEELHLLQGELWIDDRKLVPGDYNRAEPGTSDARVFSQTGCTCVLITSARDELR